MATKSIGSAGGRDYATLAAWASYANALSLSAAELGECYNDSEFTPAATVTFGGWTGASSSNTVTLKCAAGQSFRDNANVQTNALRYNQANGVGVKSSVAFASLISVTGAFFILDGLQVKTTDSTGGCYLASAAISGCKVQNFIFECASTNSNRGALKTFNVTDFIAQNGLCLMTAAGGSAAGVEDVGGANAATYYDLTIVSSNGSTATGFLNDFTTRPVVKNCAVAGFTTDYSGTCGTSANNATDKGSFGGTGYGTSGQVSLVGTTEWVSVTAGSEDLRLNSTSAKLKDNGATIGPANDIAGTSRPQGSAYDVGCWELVAAVASDIIPLYQLRGMGPQSYGLRQ